MQFPADIEAFLSKLSPEEREKFITNAVREKIPSHIRAPKYLEQTLLFSDDFSAPSSEKSDTNTLTLFTDGASRGNPGESGAGWVIQKGDEILEEGYEYLGIMTNNQAEYRALLHGLKSVEKFSPKNIQIKMDSELIIKQLKGEYRVKHEDLKPLFLEAFSLLNKYSWKAQHIPREKNKEADRLSNKAIDYK